LNIRGRKWWEAGEDCIMRSFITYTLRLIFVSELVPVLNQVPLHEDVYLSYFITTEIRSRKMRYWELVVRMGET
jgi:hypothetical protein